jgi:hypothetical protein
MEQRSVNNQYLTGIEELDTGILLSSNLLTLINLYNTSKSSRNLIIKIFPEWLSINNPNNSFSKISDIGFELLKNNNETLLKQLIKIYVKNPDQLDHTYMMICVLN